MEGALHGVRSVALSQYHGPATAGGDPFAAARAHGAALLRKLLATPAPCPRLLRRLPQRQLPRPARRPRCAAPAPPTRATAAPPPSASSRTPRPNGRTFLWLTHGHGNADSPHGSDSRECHDGWITVTPLVADLTAHDLILPLAETLR